MVQKCDKDESKDPAIVIPEQRLITFLLRIMCIRITLLLNIKRTKTTQASSSP